MYKLISNIGINHWVARYIQTTSDLFARFVFAYLRLPKLHLIPAPYSDTALNTLLYQRKFKENNCLYLNPKYLHLEKIKIPGITVMRQIGYEIILFCR
ncbi:MAG: hypothetical protein RBT61_10825 [Candidatus Kapabacteria bacterium]|jgi:hypothetical protein|nr:hypothetical protein [Candidatus Kapabacteria bacterium]